jgi:hypothetical protein
MCCHQRQPPKARQVARGEAMECVAPAVSSPFGVVYIIKDNLNLQQASYIREGGDLQGGGA